MDDCWVAYKGLDLNKIKKVQGQPGRLSCLGDCVTKVVSTACRNTVGQGGGTHLNQPLFRQIITVLSLCLAPEFGTLVALRALRRPQRHTFGSSVLCFPSSVLCLPSSILCLPSSVLCFPLSVQCLPSSLLCFPLSRLCYTFINIVFSFIDLVYLCQYCVFLHQTCVFLCQYCVFLRQYLVYLCQYMYIVLLCFLHFCFNFTTLKTHNIDTWHPLRIPLPQTPPPAQSVQMERKKQVLCQTTSKAVKWS